MKYTFTIYTIISTYLHLIVFHGDDNKSYSKKIMSVLGELFCNIYLALLSCFKWVCKQFLLSGVHNEPGIFFAFCTNRLRREISTPKASHDSFAVMNKGKRPEKLFSKTFLAFKSPFHQDFLATSRITFLAVNSQKVVPCKG